MPKTEISAADVLEALDKLVVTRESRALLVDAEALMVTDRQVRYWKLVEESPGQWCHRPSGEETGPLGEALHSIALVYLNPYRPQEAQSGG